MNSLSRRKFVKSTLSASLLLGIGDPLLAEKEAVSVVGNPIKVGVIGTGNRGSRLLSELLRMEDVEITAVCDLFSDRAERAALQCRKAGKQNPRIYQNNDSSWKEMLDKEKLDAVIIATYWDSHAPIGIWAMERGIYPGIEVPAALTVDDCWRLTETSEKTGIPCMMLENWSFRRDNLALLNMKREGLLGEIVHCHCAHSHDCIDHWFFDTATGEDRWPAKYLEEFNRDQYPTHSVGPVLSWLDINCGDVITEIYSTASASKGINAYMTRKFGKDHPNAKKHFNQGDIVTSTLKTYQGKTIVVNYDMQLPRPYSNRWMLQGTLGVYDEEKSSVYLTGKSPDYHQWEPWKPYEEKYLHKWWKVGDQGGSHGGTDFLELSKFVEAVRTKGPTPLSVYDSVVMSAIVELSGISIKKGKPVDFPDFTKGAWKVTPPYFGL